MTLFFESPELIHNKILKYLFSFNNFSYYEHFLELHLSKPQNMAKCLVMFIAIKLGFSCRSPLFISKIRSKISVQIFRSTVYTCLHMSNASFTKSSFYALFCFYKRPTLVQVCLHSLKCRQLKRQSPFIYMEKICEHYQTLKSNLSLPALMKIVAENEGLKYNNMLDC